MLRHVSLVEARRAAALGVQKDLVLLPNAAAACVSHELLDEASFRVFTVGDDDAEG